MGKNIRPDLETSFYKLGYEFGKIIAPKNLDEVKNFQKDELSAELGLEHLIKTSPVRIKCALLSLKALKYGIYSYFVEKMNDTEAAGNLKEEAASLY